MRRRLACTAALTVTAMLGAGLQVTEAPPASAAVSPTVAYTYDKAGRLKTVTDPTGASATYNYDPVGNLTSIARAAAPVARVAGPQPARMLPPKITKVEWGTGTITVRGRNFESDRALDTVQVGGQFAKVKTATGTRMVVTRPAGVRGTTSVQVSTPAGTDTFGTEPVREPYRPAKIKPGTPTADGRSALTGRILGTDAKPLAGVLVSIDETSTRTRADGRFTLTGLSAGHHELHYDASAIGHGLFELGVDLKKGLATALPWTSYLPKIDEKNAVAIPAKVTKRTVITSPAIPGLRVIIPAGSSIVDEDGKPVRRMSITKMPLDRQPFPGAPGMPLAWTIQPGGAEVKGEGLQVVYPNITNQPPGTRIDYVDNDAERPGQGWAVYGHGEVSADGKSIWPDATTRLDETYLLGVTYSPPCLIKIFCPAPGEESADGDPVNLSTGLFMMSRTDLALPDVNPIALTRSYRQNDRVVRSFGIGQSDDFNLFMAPDQAGNYVLGMPDGQTVKFAPATDGTYRAAPTPTAFAGAVLTTDRYQNFSITQRSGTVYTFGTHAALLIAITDRYGNTTTLDRAYSGTLNQVISPNGRWLDFTWGPCGSSSCITKVGDNLGRSARYTYDSSGRMLTAVDPKGGVTTYTWAPCSDDARCTQITAITDPLGIQYLRNTYDANGRVATQTQADGGVYRFAYTLGTDGAVTTTAVTDPKSVVRRVAFNTAGYTVSDTAAAGTSLQQVTTLTRDPVTNLVTAVVDPTGRRATSTYDADGNILTNTRMAGTADAVTTSFTYEPRYGRMTSATNALGRVSRFEYDDDNDIVTVIDPLGRRASTTNLAGQPVSTTDALGNTSHISYLDGAPVAIADALGRVSTTYYDAAGRPIRRADALRNTSTLTYDVLNQLTKVVDPLGNSTSATYDANGNQLSITDANGKATRWTYSRMGQALTRTDALNRVSSSEYDLLGQVVGTTDQKGTVTKATYDALGRLASTGFGATTTSGTTTFRSTVATTYDTANRPTTITDSTGGTLTNTYDVFDRITKQVSPQGTISFAYDKSDRRTSMTVTGQAPVTYVWDNADQLTSITQGTAVTRFGYDGAERRTSLTQPNGVVTTYGYDAAGQLSTLKYTSGTTTLGDLAYQYDAAGRRTQMSGSYARTTLPAAMSAATYDAANQLTKLDTTSFSYDANGQLIGDGAITYAWNDRQQLSGLTGTVNAAFKYDAAGRRTSRTVGATTVNYLYDGANAVQELNGTTPVANMVAGPGVDETLQRTDATGAHFPLTDALGSVLAQMGSTGAPQNTYTYEPFGKTTVTGPASTNSAQFTGRENDGTGLYYYRARYYSPTAQRFISADPAGEAASGTNLYAYVGNSPTNYTDPSGEVLLAGCVGGAAFDVAFNWASAALSGRKYTFGDGVRDAAVGCVSGAAGAWVGKALAGARLFGKGGKATSCALHSFDGDTDVVMADGSRKPISTVTPGDRVRTTDPETGETVVAEVTRRFENHDTALTDVTVRDGAGRESVVHTTTGHPFYDQDRKKWVEAGSLAAGTELRTPARNTAEVVSVRSFIGAKTMYDLTVADVHTYFVAAGATPVLVHNCGRSLWTSTNSKSAVENALSHANKHGGEFPGVRNSVDYVKKARDFFDNPSSGVLSKTRSNGDVVRFDPSNNYFGVMTQNGTPRTFFVPDPAKHGYADNLAYFHAQ